MPLSAVKPRASETSKEFVKCRFLTLFIMKCCTYLVFN